MYTSDSHASAAKCRGMCRWRRRLAACLIPIGLQASYAIAAESAYDIPAGPLSEVLSRFAAEAGVGITVDEKALGGLQSEGLKGSYEVEAGLRRLLRNSGRTFERTPAGYVLVVSPRENAAPGRSASERHEIVLAETLVVDRFEPGGPMEIDRQVIEAMPGGNGDITSLLRMDPNVQFDDKQLSSRTPGEIAPANISINGAKFYQNAFVVDGANMNNDIDPVWSKPNSSTDVPGRSQGLALDTDLLERITVYDSNVPAAYGRFNGGVVEATTRKPSKDLHGRLAYQTSRSEWTHYHIDESQREAFEHSASHDEQPEFEKTVLRGTLEGYLTEDFGMLANFGQRRSTMPTSVYSFHNQDDAHSGKRDQKREIDNYFVKAVWRPMSRLDVESSITYAPESNTYWHSNTADSGFETRSGGRQLNFKAHWRGDLASVEHNLAWSRIEQSRDSAFDDWYVWRKSTSKSWGVKNTEDANSPQGGYGDVDQVQNTWAYRLNADWRAFSSFGATHRLQTGFEYSRQYVRYARLTESSVYVAPDATSTCTNKYGVIDHETCSLGTTTNGWDGQYFTRRTRYASGRFDFVARQWGFWLQDELEIGRLSLRPGVRIDGDDYMDRTTAAPRFVARYDVFADQNTQLIAGANRYYGRNISSWRLQDGRNRLLYTAEKRKSLDDDWTLGTLARNNVRFSRLDIPYDDELTIGIGQRWLGMLFDLKYVNRKGRDQVIEVSGKAIGQPSTDPTLSDDYKTYTNGGRSDTDIVTLTVTFLRELEWLGSFTSGQLAFDWQDSNSNAPDYLSVGTENDIYIENPYIQYDGKFIRYVDRPAGNYSRPWTLRLSAVTRLPEWNLSWSNFLRYRAGYSKIAQTKSAAQSDVLYDGQPVAVWERRNFSNALTWDLRLAWELPLSRDVAFFANLDIFNMLDARAVAGSSGVSADAIPTYEVGRQFWLEAGVRF